MSSLGMIVWSRIAASSPWPNGPVSHRIRQCVFGCVREDQSLPFGGWNCWSLQAIWKLGLTGSIGRQCVCVHVISEHQQVCFCSVYAIGYSRTSGIHLDVPCLCVWRVVCIGPFIGFSHCYACSCCTLRQLCGRTAMNVIFLPICTRCSLLPGMIGHIPPSQQTGQNNNK